jgi:hypothetical protein
LRRSPTGATGRSLSMVRSPDVALPVSVLTVY